MKHPSDQGSLDSTLMQCLAFSRDLQNKNKSFKFNFLTTNFNCSMTTIVKFKKKVSPNTLKRNARKTVEYTQKKVKTAVNEVISERTQPNRKKALPRRLMISNENSVIESWGQPRVENTYGKGSQIRILT